MPMGRGLRMYMMANDNRRESRENMRPIYNIDGTYNVRVGDGGNRAEGGSRQRMEYGEGGENRRRMEQREDGEYAERRRMEYDERRRMEQREDGENRRRNGGEEYENRRMDDDDDYEPDYETRRGMTYETEDRRNRRDGGQYGRGDDERRRIGFGARMMDGEHHTGGERMQKGSTMEHGIRFGKEEALEWVRSMRGVDKNIPVGGKWTPDQVEPLAKKYGIPVDGPMWWEFYAMVNAMYADYSEVAKRFNITSPDYYAMMAKAFMEDKDAMPDKVALYYEYIAQK